MSSQIVRITINGEVFEETVPIRMLLTDFIRERAGLTGTDHDRGEVSLIVGHGEAPNKR